MKYLYCARKWVRPMPHRTVKNHAPRNPSHVFFGEIWMRGVRPKVIPQRYAQMSLVITMETGRMNQMNPSRMLLMTKCACPTIKNRAMWVQANWVNWNL
jgi:hypothetical protein